MTGKVLGAALVVAACACFGFTMAAGYRRELYGLRQIIAALNFMECELQYRHTPLPELCRSTAREVDRPIGTILQGLGSELERQVRPDVASCMHAALQTGPELPKSLADILKELGHTLGRYDLSGQLKGLEALRNLCTERLNTWTENSRQRIRSYQTLGLCAGIALAILMI